MKVMDSSGWLHYFMNGPLTERYSEILSGKQNQLVTPTIVLYEVSKRLKQAAGEDLVAECESQMEKTHVVDLTSDIALRAAELSIQYKLATADSIVYASADVLGMNLITSDSDFKNLPRVEYIPQEK